MAAYFWVGGTGTWSGTGNTQFAVTTGGAPTVLDPTNADSVTFDANSGTAATVTVTSTAVSLSTTINKADITLSLSGSPTLCTAAGTCTLTAGTMSLNTFTLSTGLFNSSNTNTRVLAFGTGNITLTGVSTTIFDTTTVTGMTITGTLVVNCVATTGTAVQTRTFIVGNFGEAQSISVNINPGTSAVDIFRLATTTSALKDVTFSSTFTGTVNISNSISIYGSLDFGGATAYAGTSTVTFAATSGIKTIRTNGRTFGGGVTFSGVGGAWTCSDNLSATGTLTLTAGTFNLGGFNLTAAAFGSNNSNVRTLTQGAGTITLTGSSATIWNTGTSTNLTYPTTPTVDATYSGAVGSRTINTSATSQFNLNVTAGTDTITNVAGSGFNNLNFTGFAGTLANVGRFIYGNLTLSTGMTLTAGALITQFSGVGTATITSNTQTMDFPVTFNGTGTTNCLDALTLGATRALTFTNGTLNLKSGATSTVGSFVTTGTTAKYLGSTTPGTQATISDASGTDTVTYLTIRDSNATGGATWNALAITNVDAGNNTGWLFSSTPSVSNEVTMRLRSFTQPRRF